MSEIILKDESYKIVGICMEVHRELGMGFKEAVYKEALEMEFTNQHIPYEREKLFKIEYKGKMLKHKYPADFIVFNQLILEVKATSFIVDSFVAQTINYLKASGLKLGIIANFGQSSFVYKRIVF
jgi:GxxExxY protein